MTLVAQLVLALWISGCLTGFVVFAAHTYLTKQLPAGADITARLVYRAGQVALWAAPIIAASALATAVAWTIARALGSV